nr:MAG TPA: Putative CRISPR-associated protein [Caudoviricetes sp.]
MPYAMPQQNDKQEAGKAAKWQLHFAARTSRLLFVGADRGCGFIQHAVNKLVAVFCAKRFCQFNSFVDGHFIRHISTFRQFKQRDTQYRFLDLAQLFEQTGQVGLHQSIEICAVSRHPGQQFAEIRDVDIFDILFRQELVFNIGDVVLGQLPGVKRLDGTLTGAATSSRFHGNSPYKKIRL